MSATWVVLLFVLNTLLMPLVVQLLTEQAPAVARWVVIFAVRLLPQDDRGRYRDEWLAELDEMQRENVSQLVTSLRILLGAPSTGWALRARSRRQPLAGAERERLLFEYQAKGLFAEYGVPIPTGKVATTAQEARAIAADFAASGRPGVVIKAQVKTGGRGKAGGVKLASGPDEAAEKAGKILGMDIKGHTVHSVLVVEDVDIAQEYYLSFFIDRAERTFLAMCSVEGGVEIEEVARTKPEALAKIPIDPLTGVDSAKAMEIVRAGGLPPEALAGAAALAKRLWAVFADENATLVEVNPLVLTGDGRVVALDAKVTLDDNAAFRHDWAGLADPSAADPIEASSGADRLAGPIGGQCSPVSPCRHGARRPTAAMTAASQRALRI
jgi:hypothetical protein